MNNEIIEEIKITFDITGQISMISDDLECIIIYEQKLSKNGGFTPLSEGVFSFTFMKNKPLEILSIPTWDEFILDFNQKRVKKFRPLWMDEEEYPEWFSSNPFLKNQLIYKL